VIVRRARLEDAAAIAEVHVRTWQAAYEHVFGAERLAGIDLAAREGLARRFATDGSYDAFVADDDGRVVGFAASGEPDHGEAARELFAIYVLPDAWGSEAAAGLMRATLDAMRRRGAADAILWVLADNPRARRFYEREGWQEDEFAEAEYLGVDVPLVRCRTEL
jgi:GNAT superfamily N-acetyltransferase